MLSSHNSNLILQQSFVSNRTPRKYGRQLLSKNRTSGEENCLEGAYNWIIMDTFYIACLVDKKPNRVHVSGCQRVRPFPSRRRCTSMSAAVAVRNYATYSTSIMRLRYLLSPSSLDRSHLICRRFGQVMHSCVHFTNAISTRS